MGSYIILRRLYGAATIVIVGADDEIIYKQSVEGRVATGSDYKIKIDIDYDEITTWYVETRAQQFEILYTVERAK